MPFVQYKNSKISYKVFGGKFKKRSEEILFSLDNKKITIDEISGSDDILVTNFTNIFNPSHYTFDDVVLREKSFYLVSILEKNRFDCSKEVSAFEQIFTVNVNYSDDSEEVVITEQSFIDFNTAYLFAKENEELISLGLLKKEENNKPDHLLEYFELHKNLKINEIAESDY